jgi:hypothetical protein
MNSMKDRVRLRLNWQQLHAYLARMLTMSSSITRGDIRYGCNKTSFRGVSFLNFIRFSIGVD